MVVILGYFYFGQDQRLTDEAAVVAAAANATAWVVAGGYANVIVEIANEIDVPLYTHAILKPERCHELIEVVQQASAGRVGNRAGRLLVGTSYRGGSIPRANVTDVADVLFLHGNHVDEPDEIRSMVRKIRAAPDYRGQPIVFNEDDHFEFDAGRQQLHGRSRRGRQLGAVRLPPAGRRRPNAVFRACPWTGASTRPQARLLQSRGRDDRQRGAFLMP